MAKDEAIGEGYEQNLGDLANAVTAGLDRLVSENVVKGYVEYTSMGRLTVMWAIKEDVPRPVSRQLGASSH